MSADLVERLRHLAVDLTQNEHLPDSGWVTEAAARIEELEAENARLLLRLAGCQCAEATPP